MHVQSHLFKTQDQRSRAFSLTLEKYLSGVAFIVDFEHKRSTLWRVSIFG